MPTYEYRCKSCGHQMEAVQAFTDDALTDCPECQTAGSLKKVFGNVGIAFKGSGFYKTDSRSGSSAAKTADSKPAESSTGSSDSSSSSSSSSSDKSTTPAPAKEKSATPAAATS